MKNKSIKLILIMVVIVALFVTIVLLISNKNNIIKDNDIKQDEIMATAVNNIVGQNNNIIKENLEILSIRTETNSPITNSTNKYKISDGIKDYANPSNIELYKLLYDAVDQLKDEVDISSFELDDTEITNLTNAIWNRYNSEFFYIKNFKINKDKTKFIIKYNYDKETVTKMKNDFNNKVDYILNEVVSPNSSELEKEFAIYKYLTENSHYNYDKNLSGDDINCYSILVNGKGICFGYSYAMKYLMEKLGIECYTVDSDEIAHMWNMVKIDGVYYHLDVTWGVGSNSLNYFNFTDNERKQNSDYQVWYGGNRNFVRTTLPVCDSTRFQFLQDATNPYLNNGWFYYSNLNDDYKLYKIRTNGTDNTKICDDMAGSIAVDNIWVYYCNSNDNGYLYKIKKDGSEKTLVNKVSTFKVSINNNELSYFDVTTEKENRIKLELHKMDIDISNCNIEEYPQVIGPRTDFFVTFNKKIDDDSLINKNIFLLDSLNNIIDIKLDIENSDTIKVYPRKLLSPENKYLLYIRKGLYSKDNLNLDKDIIIKLN